MDENQFNNIVRYLDNEMPIEERTAFEEQLRNDEELAQELAFQQDFHGYLERRKPDLRKDLKHFADEFITEPDNKRTFPFWIILPTLLFLAVISYFIFFYNNNSTSENLPPTSDTETQISDDINNENEDQNSSDEKTEPDNNSESNDNSEEPQLPPNQPIASLDKADFERNPILEAVIEETYRETVSEDTTILTAPKPDAEFKFGNTIPIFVNGLTTISPSYVLTIYSNRSFDIENDFPILNVPLNGSTENGKYRFQFNGNVPLKKGLYYLIIKRENLIDVIHIARFTVK
jgi:hypothetical protein